MWEIVCGVNRCDLMLHKYIATGEDRYVKSELNEQLSEDFRYRLPKTGRGKPVLLTWLVLERCILMYPERFWDKSSAAFKCSECTDKLCTQYCQKLRK